MFGRGFFDFWRFGRSPGVGRASLGHTLTFSVGHPPSVVFLVDMTHFLLNLDIYGVYGVLN